MDTFSVVGIVYAQSGSNYSANGFENIVGCKDSVQLKRIILSLGLGRL